MECKDKTPRKQGFLKLIRIVPEWNVKYQNPLALFIPTMIRIVPEWNVKVIDAVIEEKSGIIRIVPEWNVKV